MGDGMSSQPKRPKSLQARMNKRTRAAGAGAPIECLETRRLFSTGLIANPPSIDVQSESNATFGSSIAPVTIDLAPALSSPGSTAALATVCMKAVANSDSGENSASASTAAAEGGVYWVGGTVFTASSSAGPTELQQALSVATGTIQFNGGHIGLPTGKAQFFGDGHHDWRNAGNSDATTTATAGVLHADQGLLIAPAGASQDSSSPNARTSNPAHDRADDSDDATGAAAAGGPANGGEIAGNVPLSYSGYFLAPPGGFVFRGLKHAAPLILHAGRPIGGEDISLAPVTPLAQTPDSPSISSLAHAENSGISLDPASVSLALPPTVSTARFTSKGVFSSFGTVATALPSAVIVAGSATVAAQAATGLASASNRAADALALVGSAESISTAVAYNFVHFNPGALLNDAIAVFSSESASITPITQTTHSLTRAWTITASVVAFDAVFLGYWYQKAKKERAEKLKKAPVGIRSIAPVRRRRPH